MYSPLLLLSLDSENTPARLPHSHSHRLFIMLITEAHIYINHRLIYVYKSFEYW